MKQAAPSVLNTLIMAIVSLVLIFMSLQFTKAEQDTVALILLVAGLIGIGITFIAGLAGIHVPRK